jgi:enhancing lycopene biosynthesis protein 2
MRSTKDLIDELHRDADSGHYSFVALVLGFQNTTEFVISDEGSNADQLTKLNSAIGAGGKPIGMLGVKPAATGNMGAVGVRLLPEHGDDPERRKYLQTLAATFVAILESKGLAASARPSN